MFVDCIPLFAYNIILELASNNMRGVFMRRMVNLQMSIFGSFESIGADPTLVSELIPLYKNKFIPSIIQMAGIDPLNNTLKNINRLSMVSVDNKITIVFLPDRIDCNYSFEDTKADPSTLEATLKDMCHLMECTAEHFSIIGNRIAINGRFVTDEISLKYSDYILERPFYEEAVPSEWSLNSNAVTDINILDSNEATNNILNIALGKNAQDELAIIISFDVNTVPSNTIMRFKKDAFPAFLEQVLCRLDSMLSGLR